MPKQALHGMVFPNFGTGFRKMSFFELAYTAKTKGLV